MNKFDTISKIWNYFQGCSNSVELFSPKRNPLDCPFKSSQRLLKILILTLRCAV